MTEHIDTAPFIEFNRSIEELELPGSIYDQLTITAGKYGQKLAWNFIDSDIQRNWFEVLALVDNAANAFSSIGIKAGTHVGVMSWNREEFLITWLALSKLQAVMVPINASYTSRELDYALQLSDAEYLFIENDFAVLFEEAEASKTFKNVIYFDPNDKDTLTWKSIHDNVSGQIPEIERNRNALLNLQFTSGTTGFSKACELTNDYWLTLGASSTAFFGSDIKRFYVGSSIYYMVGQRIFLNALFSGGTIFVPRKPSAKRFMSDVSKYECEYCAAFEIVFKQPPSEADRDHKLKLVSIFGFSKDNHKQFEERFGVRGQEFYGMTEIGGATYMPRELLVQMSGSGSCGISAPWREVAVFDTETNKQVTANSIGELRVRGRSILRGYYKNPEATEDSFIDGWFTTGDLARIDEQGFVYILGRNKDMVRRMGENIACREVESVIRQIPEIEEVALIPVPDEFRGEEGKVYIKLHEGKSPEIVTPQLILDFCKGKLADFKIPRYLEYRTEFPLTDSQRVQKKKLIAEKPDLTVGAFDRQTGTWNS